MKKKISVIYSFRNEEENIKELIRRSQSTLEKSGHDFEIIFVNDNSSDNSRAILEEVMSSNDKIKLINNSNRFGQAQGTLAGMQYATGDAIIYLDSDLQDPPELFIELISKWEQGFEVVHTRRTKRRGESLAKMILTRIAYRIINKLSFINIPINCGDFKLVDRKVVNELLKVQEEEPYLRSIISWIGYRQAFIDYERDARGAGKTHFPLWGLNPFETFFIGLTSFSVFPLYLPIIFTLFSFAIMIVAVAYFYFQTSPIRDIHYIIFAIHCALNIILTCFSIFGVYLARIHMQSRGRQHFIIESILGFENE